MKTFLSVMIFAVGLLWTQSAAFADLPEPRGGKTENANIVAGRKAIEAQDFKAAVGHLTKAVQEEPKNADAQSMLGYAIESSAPSINRWSIIRRRSRSIRVTATPMSISASFIST